CARSFYGGSYYFDFW
nr:immunoglobulin heavy chain junction region [Mus musculus]